MSLDYVLGRRVVSVSDPEEGDEWNWKLHLEGEVLLVYTGNLDKPANEEVEGTTLGTVTKEGVSYERLDFYSGDPPENTFTMTVGLDSIEVQWPEGQQPPNADRGDPADDLPTDPSGERLLEGPVENSAEE